VQVMGNSIIHNLRAAAVESRFGFQVSLIPFRTLQPMKIFEAGKGFSDCKDISYPFLLQLQVYQNSMVIFVAGN